MNSKLAAVLVAISLAVFLYTASLYKPTGSVIRQEFPPEARDAANMSVNRTNADTAEAPGNKSGLNATASTPGLRPSAGPVGNNSNASDAKCSSINCPKSVIVCPDGTRSSCRNFCLPDTGACTDCRPECIDSGPKATEAAEKPQPPCTENWQCGPWGECRDGYRGRECSDANSCGTGNAKPPLTEQCQPKQEQPASIRIISIQADAPGDDRKKESWNGEWVLIEGFAPDMTGYTLSDSSNHTFTFPDGFALAGRAKIYSGDGNNTKDELYWNGGRRPIWNNDGDKATIRDREGKIAAEYEY